MEIAVETEDLARTYRAGRGRGTDKREVVALDGVSLSIPSGELFGLLGPNGAGKTTLIKVLVTLLLPTRGRARVAGFDVAKEAQRVRERIAIVSGGEISGYGLLTVREQLWMFSQFYGLPGKKARARIDELLEVVGLRDAAKRRMSALSTGMRQKVNLVRALLPDPEVLFLDEPSVGLDVGAARDIRAYIRQWVAERPGRTILLTTHYMQEADELCDRVAIIHRGRVVACDEPAELRRRSSRAGSFVITTEELDGSVAVERLPGVRAASTRPAGERVELHVQVAEEGAIAGIVRALADADRRIFSMEKIEPSLEEAFVEIVGTRLEEADEGAAE